MISFSTRTCGQHAHPEFTVQFAGKPIPGGERLLLSYFEAEVARGARFGPGHTIGLGGHTLRLVDRRDGTLGVEEPIPSPKPKWIEAVDRTVREVMFQRWICDSVGQLPSFPPRGSDCLASACSEGSDAIVLTRVEPPAGLPQASGWMISCPEDHDHGERTPLPLLALSALRPFAVQFLALPTESAVLLLPPGRAHVFFRGKGVIPAAGSYLESLNQRG